MTLPSLLTSFLPTPSARRATGDSPLIVHAWSEFLPTPSARRATQHLAADQRVLDISTHALREEGDWQAWRTGRAIKNFYPRPPRGGRRGTAP